MAATIQLFCLTWLALRYELRSNHQKSRHGYQEDPEPSVKPSLRLAPSQAVSYPKGKKTHHHTCDQQGQTQGGPLPAGEVNHLLLSYVYIEAIYASKVCAGT